MHYLVYIRYLWYQPIKLADDLFLGVGLRPFGSVPEGTKFLWKFSDDKTASEVLSKGSVIAERKNC